jgi:sugar phosphate isomerase/epimerase
LAILAKYISGPFPYNTGMNPQYEFSVFTKPWKDPIEALGKKIKQWGFDGIELPVRPGFQVEPAKIERDLPQATRTLADLGLKIHSVAGSIDEPTMAACAASGIPMIRICLQIPEHANYLEFEAQTRKEWEQLVPLLDRYQVTIGVQNHCDRWVANAMGLRTLLDGFDSKHVAAVWDPAHNALNGEQLDLALDIIEAKTCMVNLKNAYWKRQNGPEAEYATWRPHWTTGRHGQASWPLVAAELKRRQWSGPLCLTAEYSDEASVDRLAQQDIAFAKQLFANS